MGQPQNHWMVWIGRTLRDHPNSRDICSYMGLLSVSKDGQPVPVFYHPRYDNFEIMTAQSHFQPAFCPLHFTSQALHSHSSELVWVPIHFYKTFNSSIIHHLSIQSHIKNSPLIAVPNRHLHIPVKTQLLRFNLQFITWKSSLWHQQCSFQSV